MKKILVFILVIGFFCSCTSSANKEENQFPNILVILADDLGYGDVQCYHPESEIPTPNLNRLAEEGMMFMDGHSPSTVCTPTRYSLLTGRMEFRTGFSGVFSSLTGSCLIDEERLTLPGMLKEKGYATAMFGKWHVGMTFYDTLGNPVQGQFLESVKNADFSRSISDGPVHRGFDEFFGTVNCPTTSWLYAFVDGDRIPVPPTELIDRSKLPEHPYSKDCREGMIAPGFPMEEVDMVFLEKSLGFLKRHAEKAPDEPFFLYHSCQAVHLPSFAGKDFKGKTSGGPHGDFIFELDHIVGELLKGLEENGFADNTLVIFTSDNGPETTTTIHMRKDQGHDPAHPWRGMKRDQWEGGHRVPLIIRWPGKVDEGSRLDQMISLTDIIATCAAITGYQLPENAAEDSYDFLPVLLGEQGTEPVREYMLQQTIRLELAIRNGTWKYLDHKGSGGNDYEKRPQMRVFMIPDTDPDAPGQLYNLETDPAETINLYSQHPEIVNQLKSQLDAYVESGRSAPSR